MKKLILAATLTAMSFCSFASIRTVEDVAVHTCSLKEGNLVAKNVKLIVGINEFEGAWAQLQGDNFSQKWSPLHGEKIEHTTILIGENRTTHVQLLMADGKKGEVGVLYNSQSLLICKYSETLTMVDYK